MNKLIKPLITEKSARDFHNGVYLLAVRADATKPQIKKEAKAIYGVDVVSVNTIKLPAKQVRFRRHSGQRAARYRAIITLKKGQTFPGIDIPKTESAPNKKEKVKK